jgi:hypothetical protein
MTPADLATLLAQARPALDAMAQPWCVIGSAALIIARVPLAACDDLDILTTDSGAGFLENAWADRRAGAYAPDPASPFRSRFSRYLWPLGAGEGALEVMGDLRFKDAPVAVQEIAAAPFGDQIIPIPTIAEQARLLRLFGRPKDTARLALLARMSD